MMCLRACVCVRVQVTDSGKRSKKGRLTLERDAKGRLITVTEGCGDIRDDVLVEVYRDGALCFEWTLDQIRLRAALPAYTPEQVEVVTKPSGKAAGCCCVS